MSGTLKDPEDLKEILTIIDKYLEKNPRPLPFNRSKILEIAEANKKTQQKIKNFINSDPNLDKFVYAFSDAKNIQICFLVDVTASMKDFDILKKSVITQVISKLFDLKISGARRFSYIGYRERDEEYEFEQFKEDNKQKVYEAIKKSKMKGGGDMAEDVEFAFELFVKKLAYEPKVKIFYFLNFNKLD